MQNDSLFTMTIPFLALSAIGEKMSRHEAISKLAYELWERTQSDSLTNWYQAIKFLRMYLVNHNLDGVLF
jgi:hypothetical protein